MRAMETRKQTTRMIIMTAAMLLAGCMVGPDYKAPKTEVPDRYAAAPATQPAQSVAWWSMFADPELDRLIGEARQSNLNLRAAEARVREARAIRGATESDLYPS